MGPEPNFFGALLCSWEKLYIDQIDILFSGGLNILNQQDAIRILSQENYYRLINRYKDLFLASNSPSELYKIGAILSELYALIDSTNN